MGQVEAELGLVWTVLFWTKNSSKQGLCETNDNSQAGICTELARPRLQVRAFKQIDH